MQCDRARILMVESLDGANAPALERHAAECAGCRAELERLRQVDGILRSQGLVEPPPGFASRTMSLIDTRLAAADMWRRGLLTAGSLVLGAVLVTAAVATAICGLLATIAIAGGGADPLATVRVSAIALGVLANSVARGVAAGAGSALLAMVVALAWFGALVVPRHAIPSACPAATDIEA